MASRTLTTVLKGDPRSVVNALDKVEGRLGRFGRAAGQAAKLVAGLGIAIGAAAGAATALAVKKYAEFGDQIHKMSLRTGFATETLSELAHAAELSGTDITMLEKAVRTMQRSIYDAGRGLSTQTDALDALGVSIEQLQGKKPEQQFDVLAMALANVEDASQRSALAASLFGRAGTQLLPMLANGAAGLREMRQEARDLGIVMSEDDARAAAEFNDNMTRLNARIDAVKFNVARALIPSLLELQEWLGPRLTLASLWLADVWRERVAPAMTSVWRWMQDTAAEIRDQLAPWVDRLREFAGNAATKIGELGEKLGLLPTEEGVTPPLLQWFSDNRDVLTAAAAGVGLLVAGFVAFKIAAAAAGVVLGVVGVALAVITSPITLIVVAAAALAAGFYLLYQRSETFRGAVQGLLPALATIAGFIGGTMRAAWEGLSTWTATYVIPALRSIGSAVSWLWGNISPGLDAIRDGFVTAFGAIVEWVATHWSPISTVLSLPVRLAWIAIRQVFDTYRVIVESVLLAIQGDWRGMLSKLWEYVVASKDRLVEAFKAVLEVGEILLSAATALGGKIVEGIVAAVKAGAGAIGGAIADAIPGGGLVGDIVGAIPGFAEGGIVRARPGGRIVRVGEGGQDEAILPLRRGGGGVALGGSMVNNFYIDATGGDPDHIGDVLVPVLQRLAARGTTVNIMADAS